jgi:hypothetical protein
MTEGMRSLVGLNEELNQGNGDIWRILLAEMAGIGQLDNGSIQPDSLKISDQDRLVSRAPHDLS